MDAISVIDSASTTLINPPFRFPDIIDARPCGLSPSKARHLKRRLIVAYCDGSLSQSIVDQAFRIFPGLKRA